jgi:transposase
MQNSWRMIQNHLDRIINYFSSKFTNAFAEGLNSRIARFISNLRWFKNDNYMLYRIITKFS